MTSAAASPRWNAFVSHRAWCICLPFLWPWVAPYQIFKSAQMITLTTRRFTPRPLMTGQQIPGLNSPGQVQASATKAMSASEPTGSEPREATSQMLQLWYLIMQDIALTCHLCRLFRWHSSTRTWRMFFAVNVALIPSKQCRKLSSSMANSSAVRMQSFAVSLAQLKIRLESVLQTKVSAPWPTWCFTPAPNRVQLTLGTQLRLAVNLASTSSLLPTRQRLWKLTCLCRKCLGG